MMKPTPVENRAGAMKTRLPQAEDMCRRLFEHMEALAYAHGETTKDTMLGQDTLSLQAAYNTFKQGASSPLMSPSSMETYMQQALDVIPKEFRVEVSQRPGEPINVPATLRLSARSLMQFVTGVNAASLQLIRPRVPSYINDIATCSHVYDDGTDAVNRDGMFMTVCNLCGVSNL